MPFIFHRKNILNLISAHQNNLDRRAINSMFSCIRIRCDETALYISSMDGEKFLEHKTKTNVGKCDMFLPGIGLYELLKKSDAETFEIVEDENNYVVKIGHGEFKFAQLKNKHLPEWVDTYSDIIEINAQEFNKALKLVRWAASTDESRPFINGVCIDIKEKLNICATDGLRLALTCLKNETTIRNTWIIGRKAISDLTKLLEDATGNIKLNFGKNALIEFETEHACATWKSLLIAGKFPEYAKIIPQSCIAKLSVNAQDLVATIERVMITTNSNQPIITLNLGSTCTIFAENATSWGKDELICEYSGPDMKISFNARLLLEIVHNLSHKLTLEMNNPHSSILIKSDQHENSLFILAPVKRD
jgi:DNA polymerase-3 subunit beta